MSESWKRLTDLARSTVAPSIFTSPKPSQADVDSADFNVTKGQIWLARWGGESLTILTLAADAGSRTVAAAPVTLEPGLEDKGSVVLDAALTPLQTCLTVWFGLARQVPIFTFVHPVAAIAEDVVDRAQRLAEDAGQSVSPTDMRQGNAILYDVSPSAIERAALDDLLEKWIRDLRPIATKSVHKPRFPTQKSPFTLLQVMTALDVSQPRAMDIVRGKQQLGFDEAERLAAYIGCPVEDVLSTAEPLPEEVVVELERPRWRHLVRSEAAELAIDEATARTRIGYQAFALAARQHGGGQAIWKQRLRMIALARYMQEKQ